MRSLGDWVPRCWVFAIKELGSSFYCLRCRTLLPRGQDLVSIGFRDNLDPYHLSGASGKLWHTEPYILSPKP